MAVPFNGVLVSREAGSLMPSLILDKVVVSDCIINTIKLDSGDEKITKDDSGEHRAPILSNPNNLPLFHNGAWSLETEFYANFNGDLEAGPISFYGKEIDGMAVRRSSNRDGFSKWEDLKIINNIQEVVNKDFEYSFDDRVVESGIWYIYAIQPIAGVERGNLYKSPMRSVIYDDAFLLGEGGRQLKLKYNFQVTSLKRNIKETRVETLGSKYPYITRSGDVDYNEFAITGLITHFMDETKDFAPRADLFIEDEFKDYTLDLSAEYSGLYRANDLDDYNNTVLEREFRKKVSDFLYDGKPKLFKSTKLGNSLIRLMDINLTPQQGINGGMVYSFTANAIEIDGATIDNFEKYNIQKR